MDADNALSAFDASIAVAKDAAACWRALELLADDVAPCKLFTVTVLDMGAGLARRVYSNNPKAYPVTGTKPIERNAWFAIVHDERAPFVRNTLSEIAAHFPDHALIGSLGLGAVVNLPVFLKDELVATVNILDVQDSYGPEQVAAIHGRLGAPAKLAYLAARQFGG